MSGTCGDERRSATPDAAVEQHLLSLAEIKELTYNQSDVIWKLLVA